MDLILEMQNKVIKDFTEKRNKQIEFLLKENNLTLLNEEEIKRRCRIEHCNSYPNNIEHLYIDDKLVATWDYSINLTFE